MQCDSEREDTFTCSSRPSPSSFCQDVVLEVDFEGERTKYTMIQVGQPGTPSAMSQMVSWTCPPLTHPCPSPVGVASAAAETQCGQASRQLPPAHRTACPGLTLPVRRHASREVGVCLFVVCLCLLYYCICTSCFFICIVCTGAIVVFLFTCVAIASTNASVWFVV